MHTWFSNSERRDNCKLLGCLLINADRFIIETPIRDEMTIYRARRAWKKALKDSLMLNENGDFKITTLKIANIHEPSAIDEQAKVFSEEYSSTALQCSFLTSFGRYAFWRIASMQAPEILEEMLLPFEKINKSSQSQSATISPEKSVREKTTQEKVSHPTLVSSSVSALLRTDCPSVSFRQAILRRIMQLFILVYKKDKGTST